MYIYDMPFRERCFRTVQFPIREQLLRSIAKQFQEGSYLRLVDFCITQL